MLRTLLILVVFIIFEQPINSQSNFFYSKDKKFFLHDSEFHFLGFGVYYLQWMSADSSSKYIIDDVFRISKQTGIKVIRTWAFNSSSDSLKKSTIRYSPYNIREEGLRALDYVIFKAKEYDVNIVLTLENNFSDFGGINQYIEWANTLLTPFTNKIYNHNDFFTDDSIKSWYKFYVKTILNRINFYTLVRYSDETNIFSFELINEASNTGFDVHIIKEWYNEMADYFKSINSNHLLTTGEIGYDTYTNYYSDWDLFYNSSQFLFNGYKGTSFIENTAIENIDYSSFHLYPDAWGFKPLAGNTWINDHVDITNIFNKPSLLGEFGVVNEKYFNYKKYLETIKNVSSKSTIVWNYMHPDLMHIADRYAFNEINNPELFELFREHVQTLDSNQTIKVNELILHQNYPNPFNPTTTIQYSIPGTEYVKVELYNSLGELIKIIDEGIKEEGTYTLFLSFNNYILASGVYFYRLIAGDYISTKKMLLLK